MSKICSVRFGAKIAGLASKFGFEPSILPMSLFGSHKQATKRLDHWLEKRFSFWLLKLSLEYGQLDGVFFGVSNFDFSKSI